MSEMTYTGHGATTGGLQGHSVGDDYPYTVIGVQRGPGRTQYAAFDTRSASEGHPRRTYAEARMDIVSAKIRNMMHS